jgi:glutathione S-transferase
MITLYQLPTWPDHPNPSPFCLKVATYLRMAKLPYEAKTGDVRKAPKGKLPYIDEDGKVLADSGHILDHLEPRARVDEGLTGAERTRAHLIRRTFEESLYFPMLYSRFCEDANFAEVKKLFEPLVPALLRGIVSRAVRKGVARQLKGQGIGRHSRDEVYAFGKADLDAIADALGDGPYFLGARARSIDAVAYGFLVNVLYARCPSPLGEHARGQPSLVAFVERMRAAYWA